MGQDKGKNGSVEGTKNYEDRPPIQFVRVGISEDGKWLLIDTISRACIHINYVRAVDRNKVASLAQEVAVGAGGKISQPEIQTASPKPKRARKENDRAS